MRHVASVHELVSILRDEGKLLWAPQPAVWAEGQEARSIPVFNTGGTNEHGLLIGVAKAHARQDDNGAGLVEANSDLVVSSELYEELCVEIQTDVSAVRRHSTRPIDRAFVFLDVSDFSKMPSGQQLLVVLALTRLAKQAPPEVTSPEAQLCIGDGYIYVFPRPVAATYFAADLAQRIEKAVADASVPEFHFRVGVHVGPVRCFWDPGRVSWNYVGDGINGAQRVLGAIGKDADDVVYLSSDVRQAILKAGDEFHLLGHLSNRGRKKDKHDNPWRVYELNHSVILF